MDIRTYRAPTMQQALAKIRSELGPSASVLHTRQVNAGPLLRWIPGLKQFEVTASATVHVPSRFAPLAGDNDAGTALDEQVASSVTPPQAAGIEEQLENLQAMVDNLYRRSRIPSPEELTPELFELYTELLDADLPEDLARELLDRLRAQGGHDRDVPSAARQRLTDIVTSEIQVAGPLRLDGDRRHLVALVGPTGVGKTTTIAKLAANYRLREKLRVGLITVDTYRIAAVEQLRTYADIIDLPMEVVSTPREMREAVARLGDMDLVLVDTAGRSPKDEVKIQELRAYLNEAQADEVLLVLSCVASATTLERTSQQFAKVGTTGLILTKLDEVSVLGNLLPLLRAARLPLSYLTHGQNVPDDIAVADARRLAQQILGQEAAPQWSGFPAIR